MADKNIWRVKKMYGLTIQQIDKSLKDEKENINESDPETKKERLYNLLTGKIDKLRREDILDKLSKLGINTKPLNGLKKEELRNVACEHYHEIIYGASLKSLKKSLENIGFIVPDDVDLRAAQQMLIRHYEDEVKCYKDSKPLNTVNTSEQYNQDELQLEQRNDPQCSQNVLRPEQHQGHQNYQPNDQTYNPETRMSTDSQMCQQSSQNQDQPRNQNEIQGLLTQVGNIQQICQRNDQTSLEIRFTNFPQMSQQCNQNQAQQQDQNQLPGPITGRRATLSIIANLQIDE